MRKVAIVTDTTACVPQEQVRKYDIEVVPVQFIFEDKTYRDGIDISPTEFYKLLRQAKKMPTTSASSPNPYLEAYRKASQLAPGILCLTEPSRFSAMFDSARVAMEMARKTLRNTAIEVLEGTTAAAGQGLVALAAAPEPQAALGALRAFSDRARLDRLLVARARRLRLDAARARAALHGERQAVEEARRLAVEALGRSSLALERRGRQLRAVQEQESLYGRAAAEMRRAAGDLDDFLAGRRQAPPAGPAPTLLKGTLPWPAPGEVLAGFGPLRHPRFGTLVPHNGIDIGAAAGTPVRAVADGAVVFADWFQGYGRTVIIDHGDGFSTLYAHNSKLLVRRGQLVERGEPIALVGHSGNATSAHCHLEVRSNSVPLDPLSFVTRRPEVRR